MGRRDIKRTVKSVLLGGAGVLGSLSAGAQQSAAPTVSAADPFANVPARSYIAAADIASRIKDAEVAAKGDADPPAGVLLKAGPTMAVMSYRKKPADHAEVHETDDELFVVLEGAGALTMGGSLVDPTRHGTSLWSNKTDGGTVYTLTKGDMILVPANSPHRVTRVDGPKLVLLSVHIVRPVTGGS